MPAINNIAFFTGRYMDTVEAVICICLLFVSALVIFFLRHKLRNKLPTPMFILSNIVSAVLLFTALMGVLHISGECKGGDKGDFETSLLVILALTLAEIGNALLSLSYFSENRSELLSGLGILSFFFAQSAYIICLLPQNYLYDFGNVLPMIALVFVLPAAAVIRAYKRSEEQNGTQLFITLSYLAATALSSVLAADMVSNAHQIYFAIGVGMIIMLVPLALLMLKKIYFKNTARWLITVSYLFYCLGQLIAAYSLSRAD